MCEKISLPLLGEVYEITPEIQNYAKIKSLCDDIIDDMKKEYIKLYKEKVDEPEEVTNVAMEMANIVLENVATKIVDYLMQNEVYDINKSTAIEDILAKGTYTKKYEELCTNYETLLYPYNRARECNDLNSALATDVRLYLADLILLMEERIGIRFLHLTKEEVKSATNIFDNLDNPNMPENKKDGLLVEILRKDPFNKVYYSYIFKNKGAKTKREIVKIAGVLGIDLSQDINEYTYDYTIKELEKGIENLKEQNLTPADLLMTEGEDAEMDKKFVENLEMIQTLEGATSIQKEIIKRLKELEVSTCENIEEINVVIEDIKRERRTFKGIEFGTEEEKLRIEELYTSLITDANYAHTLRDFRLVKERLETCALPEVLKKDISKIVMKTLPRLEEMEYKNKLPNDIFSMTPAQVNEFERHIENSNYTKGVEERARYIVYQVRQYHDQQHFYHIYTRFIENVGKKMNYVSYYAAIKYFLGKELDLEVKKVITDQLYEALEIELARNVVDPYIDAIKMPYQDLEDVCNVKYFGSDDFKLKNKVNPGELIALEIDTKGFLENYVTVTTENIVYKDKARYSYLENFDIEVKQGIRGSKVVIGDGLFNLGINTGNEVTNQQLQNLLLDTTVYFTPIAIGMNRATEYNEIIDAIKYIYAKMDDFESLHSIRGKIDALYISMQANELKKYIVDAMSIYLSDIISEELESSNINMINNIIDYNEKKKTETDVCIVALQKVLNKAREKCINKQEEAKQKAQQDNNVIQLYKETGTESKTATTGVASEENNTSESKTKKQIKITEIPEESENIADEEGNITFKVVDLSSGNMTSKIKELIDAGKGTIVGLNDLNNIANNIAIATSDKKYNTDNEYNIKASDGADNNVNDEAESEAEALEAVEKAQTEISAEVEYLSQDEVNNSNKNSTKNNALHNVKSLIMKIKNR